MLLTGQATDPNAVTGAVTTGDGSEAGFVNAKVTGCALGVCGASDLHLTKLSPLIGKGDPAYCAKVDFDGKTRPAGTCDIGAFSFAP
jgi:hypothetical protein